MTGQEVAVEVRFAANDSRYTIDAMKTPLRSNELFFVQC
jgi:hypothetical protein